MAERLPDPVAQRLAVVAAVYRNRQVSANRGLPRHGTVGRQVLHLRRHPGVGGPEQPDIGNPLAQHQQPVQAHAKRQPAAVAEARLGEHPRLGEAAFRYLDPASADLDVDLSAGPGVGVLTWHGPAGQARDQRGQQRGNHLVQVSLAERPAADAPQVQLMRRSGVLPAGESAS